MKINWPFVRFSLVMFAVLYVISAFMGIVVTYFAYLPFPGKLIWSVAFGSSEGLYLAIILFVYFQVMILYAKWRLAHYDY